MKYKAATLFVLAFLLLAGCVTTEPRGMSLTFDAAQNVYTHKQSGFSFPSEIGKFQREEGIVFYDKAGDNFSVSYNLVIAEKKTIGTVYVYPSLEDSSITPNQKSGQTPEWLLNEEYDDAKAAIIDSYGARVLSESEVGMNRSLLNLTGKKGVFEWDKVGGETVFSQLYLFSYKGWLVKYRFTYPSKYNTVIEPEIQRFLEMFRWP